jgi:hypothetical protein
MSVWGTRSMTGLRYNDALTLNAPPPYVIYFPWFFISAMFIFNPFLECFKIFELNPNTKNLYRMFAMMIL